MSLKIFNGFTLDMAAFLAGLNEREVLLLREHGIVTPSKTKQGFSYSRCV